MISVEILPGLWLSDFQGSKNSQFLTTNNIESTIDCNNYLNYSSHKYNSPLKENLEEKEIIHTLKFLVKITEYIFENLKKCNNTLICCHNNLTISISVIIAYIMRYGKMNKAQIVKSLKTKMSYITISKICNKSLDIFQSYLDKNI